MKTLVEWSNKFFDLLNTCTQDEQEVKAEDILCFKIELQQFLHSGKKDDAFSVYFCFSEIFRLFGCGYDNTKKLLEMLSDHEYHSGELLSKHRDHYSHSIYVFALGLSIYANDKFYRKNFLDFYKQEDEVASHIKFLKMWGMVALFHDVGYPFQLAHEQIKTYAEEVWGKDCENNPFVSYGNYDKFVSLDSTTQEVLSKVFQKTQPILTINDLLAHGLMLRMGYDPEQVRVILKKRVVKQPKFMDHGYFSAVILARQILATKLQNFNIEQLDVLTAILLHNSFNKYDDKNLKKHPIGIGEHPLAYLIVLCDELQCWDRLAYGKVSKRDPIAWDFALEISDNYLLAQYTYESFVVRTYNNGVELNVELNKNYSEMKDGIFVEKIHKYIDSPLNLVVKTAEQIKQKRSNLFASDDNFVSLCDLAKAIHISYNDHCKALSSEFICEDFGKLPLEFKISNIEQAKSYGYKLELINCFFSSKKLDYPVVENFNRVEAEYKNNVEFLCREEHVRWVKEKLAMGWKYGTDYTSIKERNSKKIHKDLIPYDELSPEEQSKDALMVNNIIDLLKKFDSNIKIYSYRFGRKPKLEIAGTGHRFFKDNPEKLKERIKQLLSEFSKTHHVIVRTCFAYGADQLIAECAAELGLTLKANLPMPMEEYINEVRENAIQNGRKFDDGDELRMRHLLAQAVVCKAIPDEKFTYAEANAYIVRKCDKLIALWDGRETPLEDNMGNPINRGGTYDCIKMAEKEKKEVIKIDCYR